MAKAFLNLRNRSVIWKDFPQPCENVPRYIGDFPQLAKMPGEMAKEIRDLRKPPFS